MTRQGELLGTPHFMSPEQAEGLGSVDYRADIWALGVIAFECLLGALPFKGDNVASLILTICRGPVPVPSETGPVPTGFDAWFARACARDPQHRFESAKRAADEFESLDFVATEGPPSGGLAAPVHHGNARAAMPRPQARSRSGASPLDRRPSLPIAVGLVWGALLMLAGTAWVGTHWGNSPRAEAVSTRARAAPVFAEARNTMPLAAAPPGTTGAVPSGNIPDLDRPTDVTPASEKLESKTMTQKAAGKRPLSRTALSNSRASVKPPVIDLGI
jgi:hypothetical protein